MLQSKNVNVLTFRVLDLMAYLPSYIEGIKFNAQIKTRLKIELSRWEIVIKENALRRPFISDRKDLSQGLYT